MGEALFSYILMLVLLLFPLWKIFGKAGFNPLFSLLLLIPFLGALASVLILAFARWPATEGRPGDG